MLLHFGHYAQDAASSPLFLVACMLIGAATGLAIAFSREIRGFARRDRRPLDQPDEPA